MVWSSVNAAATAAAAAAAAAGTGNVKFYKTVCV
jgi:hypothetical protein